MTICDFSNTEMMRIPPRIGGDGEMTEAKRAVRIVSCFATDAAATSFPSSCSPQRSSELRCASTSPGSASSLATLNGTTARPTFP